MKETLHNKDKNKEKNKYNGEVVRGYISGVGGKGKGYTTQGQEQGLGY